MKAVLADVLPAAGDLAGVSENSLARMAVNLLGFGRWVDQLAAVTSTTSTTTTSSSSSSRFCVCQFCSWGRWVLGGDGPHLNFGLSLWGGQSAVIVGNSGGGCGGGVFTTGGLEVAGAGGLLGGVEFRLFVVVDGWFHGDWLSSLGLELKATRMMRKSWGKKIFFLHKLRSQVCIVEPPLSGLPRYRHLLLTGSY